MELKSLADEQWREYDFDGRDSVYRIHNPQSLAVGATTHRVIDDEGIVHCIPAPGFRGCVLRWKPRKGANPVAF